MGKFKVGDKVRIKGDYVYIIKDGTNFLPEMVEYIGEDTYICIVDPNKYTYRVGADNLSYSWHEDWLELVEDEVCVDQEDLIDPLSKAFEEAEEQEDTEHSLSSDDVKERLMGSLSELDDNPLTVSVDIRHHGQVALFHGLRGRFSHFYQLHNENHGYSGSIYESNSGVDGKTDRLLCSFNNIIL